MKWRIRPWARSAGLFYNSYQMREIGKMVYLNLKNFVPAEMSPLKMKFFLHLRKRKVMER